MNRSPIFSGLTYSVIVTFVGTLLASLLLLLTQFSEQSWFTTTLVVHGISLFIGGLTTGKRCESKGWYHGSLLGALYTSIVWIIGFLAYDSGWSKELLLLGGIAVAAGALGGMIGVNTKR